MLKPREARARPVVIVDIDENSRPQFGGVTARANGSLGFFRQIIATSKALFAQRFA